MQKLFSSARLMALSVVAGAAMTLSASAGVTDGLTIFAQNASGTHSHSIPFSAFTFNAGLSAWEYSGGSQPLLDNNTNAFVATLNSVFVRYIGDPEISVNFAVQSGSTDTVFGFTSGVLSFTTIGSVSGFATTGVTLTDATPGGNGAGFTGLEGGGMGYRANYNGAIPGGSAFAMLQPSFVGGTGTTTQGPPNLNTRYPTSGNAAVAGTVSNMQAEWLFLASADDSVSVTSRYKLTPAPSGAMLLGLGGLVGMRRRRR